MRPDAPVFVPKAANHSSNDGAPISCVPTIQNRRRCSQCQQDLPREEYSANQWKKKDISRCKDCINGGGGGGRNSHSSYSNPRATNTVQDLTDIMETMSKMRFLVHGRDPHRSVEDMDTEINGLEMMSAGARNEDDVLSFYRLRELLGGARDERERVLEELRVGRVVNERRATGPDPDWNVDDEDTICAFCRAAIPIDGTTFGRDGAAVYHKRLFCCGTRACSACGCRIALSNSGEVRTPLWCPVCKGRVHGRFRDMLSVSPGPAWLHFAKKGHSWAQLHVGGLYKRGVGGMPRDASKCLEWVERAVEKRNPRAYSEMAELYMRGFGVTKSNVEVRKWMTMAAEAGDSFAQLQAGKMHSMRVYGDVNYNKSIRYMTLAAVQGNEEAQCILGEYIMDKKIDSEEPMYRSIYWFEKAAKRGFRRAQYKLSRLLISRSYNLYNGISIPKYSPMPLALFWIRQAISDGGEKEWRDHHDLLIAAPKEYCALCDNPPQIGCHTCNAVFFCGKTCQEKLNELGHDVDCRQCIVFDKGEEVVIAGLSFASHYNGKSGRVLNFHNEKSRYVIGLPQSEGGDKEILVKPNNVISPLQLVQLL